MTRLVDVLEIVKGQIVCISDGQRNTFTTNDDLLNCGMYTNYIVTSMSSENDAIVLELQPWESPVPDMDADWVKEHKEQTGSEPSFF